MRLVQRILFGALAMMSVGCVNALSSEQPVCDDPREDCNPSPDAGYRLAGQSLGYFRTSNLANRPEAGAGTNVPNVVVSAVDNYLEGPRGTTGNTWVQQRVLDPNFQGCAPDPVGGGHVCGIELYNPVVIPSGSHAIPGDIVTVTGGSYDPFTCSTCSTQFPTCGSTGLQFILAELDLPDITRLGSMAAPEPINVHLQDLDPAGLNCNATTFAQQDGYTGVLVRITDVVSTQSPDAQGNVPIDLVSPYGSSVVLGNAIGPLTNPSTGVELAYGTLLCNVVGVVSYFYSPEVLPANTSYTVVPPGTMTCPAPTSP